MMTLDTFPVLAWCVRAARAAPGVDEVVVATSTLPADDTIAEWCLAKHAWNVPVWRGSETDVLSRFVGCAEAAHADVILRLTGDCPFLDPQVIGAVVRLQKETAAHYVSNVSPRTYPDGLDVEAFTLIALTMAHTHATRPIDRDCVTTFIERNRSQLRAETLINPLPGMQDERWVLDTAEDFEFCKNIAVHWPWYKGPPSQLDILDILDANPDIRKLNANAIMNERYFDALAEEPVYARSYERSQAQFEKAKTVIPLGCQTFSKSYLQYPQPSPLCLSHGQGGLVWDIDGNEYVDAVSALLPNILGYRDPDIDGAIRKQLSSGISFSLATELEAQLAETLCRLIPCAEMVRLGKTGTDVTTAAIRLARAHTGRDRVLICGGYHGWADWSIERNLGVPEDVRRLTERVPFGNKSAARAMFDRQTVKVSPSMSYRAMLDMEKDIKKNWIAAIIVEPETDPGYLQYLRDLCDRYGALLIFDEVITGFRFDLGGAQKLYGVTPDLATFGKAMANGMPLSALVGRRDIMKRMEPPDNIFYSGTMFGETLSIAAAIATIRKLEREEIIPKLWKTGDELAERAQQQMYEHQIFDVISLFGSGPFKRLKFRDDQIAALFRKEMIASGTLIVASHNLCAAHGPSEIKRILRSYDHALSIVADALDKDDIAERLAGATVAPVVRGGLRISSRPSDGPIGDGVALISMEHPEGLIDDIADAIRSGKLKMP